MKSVSIATAIKIAEKIITLKLPFLINIIKRKINEKKESYLYYYNLIL